MSNTRYDAYAQAHGRSPDDQLAHDIEAWPGGRMCGFILWINARWVEWRKLRGRAPYEPPGEAGHADFDRWLVTRVQELTGG